ncbi:MAG: cytochrome c [Flavobacteriales bacterium]|nr:cytochrome c [Flavobacteriales bacterium]
MIKTITILIASVLGGSFFFASSSGALVNENSRLAEVMVRLGEPKPSHYLETIDPMKAKMGEQMVTLGRTYDKTLPRKSTYISTIFVCTDCHNQVQEDPFPANPTPEARLTYAKEKDLNFLQATTFWGMVNRDTWYNDDYVLKYGDLVAPAKNSLYEATQLCAQECSSGRKLEEWEAEAINHYYWSLELKLGDLKLEVGDYNRIDQAITTENPEIRRSVVSMLKSKYMTASPADFVDEPENKSKGYANTAAGNPENGKELFDRSCMTCHVYGGPSLFTLDYSKKSFRHLKRNITNDSHFSIYEIVRHGTVAELGHRQYMPLYTADRMSHQQVEDLRAYIEQEAQ